MNIQVESVSNPVYANAEGAVIRCVVKFSHLNAPVEFTASPTDIEIHGREVFARANAGEFGPVGAFVTDPQKVALEQKRIKDAADTATAKQYTKLQNLAAMSPSELQLWIDTNINNLSDAKDALKTLAIAVSILARRL